MDLVVIRHMFGYNRWATEKVLTAAQALTVAQFLAPDDTPFGSIRNQAVHILDAQLNWIDVADSGLRGTGRTPIDLEFEDFPNVEAVHKLWRDVEERTARVLDSIAPDDLEVVIPAGFDWGDMTAPLWVLLVHVVNHGTQHRSELAMKLTNFGHSPEMVDLIFYWIEHSSVTSSAE